MHASQKAQRLVYLQAHLSSDGTGRNSTSGGRRNLLERPLDLVILAHPVLSPLASDNMLDDTFAGVLL